MKQKFRKAVFILTYRKTIFGVKYLLLKRKLHWTGWEFPKGGIEPKEKPIEAAAREIKEETGQTPSNIKKYKFSGKYLYNQKFPDRKGIFGQTYQLFSAELKNKKAKIDRREHSTYKWASFKKAIKLLTWENQKQSLRIVKKTINNL